HHDRLEIEHHGVTRRRLTAHVGYRAGDKNSVDAAPAQDFGQVRRTLNKGAEAVLLDDDVFVTYVESGPELMSFAVGRERFDALGALLRRHHLEIGRPALQRIVLEGGLDPDHRSAGLAHRLSETVDVGHDLFRHWTERVRNARQHEGVLHVDNDQGGLGWIEIFVDMLAAAALDDAIDDRLRDGQPMHRSLRS